MSMFLSDSPPRRDDFGAPDSSVSGPFLPPSSSSICFLALGAESTGEAPGTMGAAAALELPLPCPPAVEDEVEEDLPPPIGVSVSDESSIEDADVLLKTTLAPTTELLLLPRVFFDRRVVVPPPALPLLPPRWSRAVDGLMRLRSRDCGVTSTPSRYTRAECEPAPGVVPFTLRLEFEIDDAPNARERDALMSCLVLRVIRLLLALILTDDGELMCRS